MAADQARHRLDRLNGTSEWILRDPLYKDWQDPHNVPQGLCVKGSPGSGKSVLASTVIQDLQSKATTIGSTRLVAYFYCHQDSKESDQVHAFLRTIVYQITLQHPRAADLVHRTLEVNGFLKDPESFSKLPPEALWELLSSSLLPCLDHESPSMFLVIDGLDELEVTEKQVLGKILRSCLNYYPWIRFLLLSRPGGDVDKSLSLLQVKTIWLTVESTFSDIESYIRHRLDSWGSLGSYEIASDIRETMTRKAQGGFLWVRLIFDELEEALDVEEIKLILEQLPVSMKDVYNTIFERMEGRLRKAEYDFLLTAIKWVLFSRIPVTLKFLAAVYSCQKPMSAGAVLYGLRRLSGSLFEGLERTRSSDIIVQSALTAFYTTTSKINHSHQMDRERRGPNKPGSQQQRVTFHARFIGRLPTQYR